MISFNYDSVLYTLPLLPGSCSPGRDRRDGVHVVTSSRLRVVPHDPAAAIFKAGMPALIVNLVRKEIPYVPLRPSFCFAW